MLIADGQAPALQIAVEGLQILKVPIYHGVVLDILDSGLDLALRVRLSDGCGYGGHAMILAEPVETVREALVFGCIVVSHQCSNVVTDELTGHAVEKPECRLYAIKPVSLVLRKVSLGKYST